VRALNRAERADADAKRIVWPLGRTEDIEVSP
jgi:hypothetical protein